MRPTVLGLAALALAIAAVTVFASAASGASYLHEGYDPGRTGAIPFEGPQTNDTAFRLELPGTVSGQTILVDGEAYLATIDSGYDEDLTDDALWRIDLDEASTEKLVDLPEASGGFQIRPDVLVYTLDQQTAADEETEHLVALEVPSGDERWRLEGASTEEEGRRDYDGRVIVGGTIYTGFRTEETAGVTAVDLATGEERWTWTRAGSEQTFSLDDATEPTRADRRPGIIRLSADTERVYPYIQLAVGQSRETPTGDAEAGRIQYELWGIDASTGEPLWTRNDTSQERLRMETSAGEHQPLDPAHGAVFGGTPAVTEERVYIRLDAFQALNPATGETVWTSRVGRTDQVKAQGSMGLSVRDGDFLGTSRQTVYGLDAVTGDPQWQRTDTTENKFYTVTSAIQSQEIAYVPTDYVREDGGPRGLGVEAVDRGDGETLWNWRYMPTVGPACCFTSDPAFGPDVMVWGVKDGTVHVVGETEASLGAPEVDDRERYPGVGEEVSLDLSDTEAGAFGPATKYRVFWGDNTTSGWQESPTFTHTYDEEGPKEARLQVGNEANQTASTFVTMRVGESEPNLLATAFKQEHQDMTFGILGIALALGGGAVGVARRYRKRNRLQEELDALEQGFEELEDQPSECEPFLDNRKARARSLALDGHLDEEQIAIVETRAEELRSQLRLGAVEEEFAFLPHGLVTKAREMLEDGEITSLEREGFLAALEESEVITGEQEALVRRRIEDWFGRDAGGG